MADLAGMGTGFVESAAVAVAVAVVDGVVAAVDAVATVVATEAVEGTAGDGMVVGSDCATVPRDWGC